MEEKYICKIASPEEMNRKWDYEIEHNPSERENWVTWKAEAISRFGAGAILPYYGILDGEIICEATAVIQPDQLPECGDAADEHTAYLEAFRTLEAFRGKGYFSRLFSFMLDDLKHRGYTGFLLGVEPEETVNKKIYAHWGFTHLVSTGTCTYPDGTVIQVEYYLKK